MLNKNIPKTILENLRLVVFDSDGVSVPRGTDIRETITPTHIEITARAQTISPELADLMRRLRKRFIVCISSGRALLYLHSMYNRILGERTVLMAENGNVSLVEGVITQLFTYDETYLTALANIKREVRETVVIEGVEPKQFILSIHTDRELPEIYDIVKKHDSRNELQVLWTGEAFDIQRKNVSKAAGLTKLCEHLNVDLREVAAMGDRINDKELLESVGVPVSADKDAVPAEYWTEGEGLPGEILARHLVETLGL